MIQTQIITRYEGLTQVQRIYDEIIYRKQLYYNGGNPADKIEVFIEKQDNVFFALVVNGPATMEREFFTQAEAEKFAATMIYNITKQFIDNISR